MVSGCKSSRCRECVNYRKFLSISTMQSFCWNMNKYFEEEINKLKSKQLTGE